MVSFQECIQMLATADQQREKSRRRLDEDTQHAALPRRVCTMYVMRYMLHVYIYIPMSMCTYTYLRICVHIYMHTYIYIYVYTCTYLCIYVLVYATVKSCATLHVDIYMQNRFYECVHRAYTFIGT